MLYSFSKGYTQQQLQELVANSRSVVVDYIKTSDGRFFAAKPRKYHWTCGCNAPHLEEVTAVFPNGRTAQYCVNLNNGIATFIKFNH